MIRQESLEEISDGKLYSENDCVKADTGNCAGCRQVCCKGMEASIVLDPYDVYRLTQKTGKSFNELINDKIEINIVDVKNGQKSVKTEMLWCMRVLQMTKLQGLFPVGQVFRWLS